MKIAFIVPADHDPQGPYSEFSDVRLFPPASLARMTGYASRRASVTFHDERIDSAAVLPKANVAVIFINSYNQHRAYQVAKHYRQRGTYTVFTGPYLNHAPEEACAHADCLFIGAGDEIIGEFLADFSRARPRRLYASSSVDTQTASESKFKGSLTLSLI